MDDKTSIAIERNVLVASVQNQSCKAPVLPSMDVLAADHGWVCEKMVSSVIQMMNNSHILGASLLSGRPNGNGRTFVSFHDATLDPSSDKDVYCLTLITTDTCSFLIMKY